MSLDCVRVVLVRPEEAGNVGAAARVAKNFGLHHLVLVRPCLDRPESAYRWARGAEEVVEGAQLADTLAEAIAPCRRAWAASRRRGRARGGVMKPRPAARDIVSLALSGQDAALVFGPESRGLANAEVAACSDRIWIPASPRQPSLNLAQAVAVCAYEVFLASRDGAPDGPAHREAALGERAALYEHLERALAAVGFLLPHTARSRMATLREALERARLKTHEVRLLRGIARKVEWAGERIASRGDEPDEGETQAADR
jgi:tRNA/rRNA methyltransferase